MKHGGFKPRASVDFQAVRFRTSNRTNLKTVQPILNRILDLPEGRNASVDLLDEIEGGSVSEFCFRLQNPESAGRVRHVINELTRLFDLAEEPTLGATEISFDMIRRKGTTDDELAEMTAHLFAMSGYSPQSANKRLYREFKGSGQAIPAHLTALTRKLIEGYCIAVGNQRDHGNQSADAISARTYFKRTDDGGDLDSAQYSARTERTFQGTGRLFQTPDDLQSLDFGTIAKLFNFRKLKNDLHPAIVATVRDRVLNLASRERTRRNGGGTRKHHPCTTADSELNELVRRSFRALARRWVKPYTCANSVNSEPLFLVTARVEGTSAKDYTLPTSNSSLSPDCSHPHDDGSWQAGIAALVLPSDVDEGNGDSASPIRPGNIHQSSCAMAGDAEGGDNALPCLDELCNGGNPHTGLSLKSYTSPAKLSHNSYPQAP